LEGWAVTGVQLINARIGVLLGFTKPVVAAVEEGGGTNNTTTTYVKFGLLSVVAGNPAFLGPEEYARRHAKLLETLVNTTWALYIIGTCFFVDEAGEYSDKFFDSRLDLLKCKEEKNGYFGSYNQVVSYSIPMLFGLHLQSAYLIVESSKVDPL
jgi:hypothetical protein